MFFIFTGKNLWTQILYIFLLALATSVVLILVIVLYTLLFYAFPLSVEPVPQSPSEALCPGDSFDFTGDFTVRDDGEFYIDFSVLDANGLINLPNTQLPGQGLIMATKTTFHASFPWTVPDLPAGNYNRGIAVRAAGRRYDPWILLTPFSIGANCK